MLLKAIVLLCLTSAGLLAHADLGCEADLIEEGAVPLLEDVVINHKMATAAVRGGLDFLLLPLSVAEAVRLMEGAGSFSGEGVLPVTDRLSNSWLQSPGLERSHVYAIVSPDVLATGPWVMSLGGSQRVSADSHRSTPPQIRDLFYSVGDDQALRGAIRQRLNFARGIVGSQVLGFLAVAGSEVLPLKQNLRRVHSEIPVIESRDLNVLRRFVRTGGLPWD